MFADEQVLTQCERRAALPVLVEPWTGRTCTGAQLVAAVRAATDALVAAGVEPHMRVGITLERGIDLVVALLAVAQSGAAYVPLDPSFPAERLRLMADDAGIQVSIAEPSTGAGPVVHLPAGVTVVHPRDWHIEGSSGVDEQADDRVPDGAAASRAHPRRVRPVRAPGDLAYVIYTSGSTGRPKGVMVTHANLHAFLQSWDAVVDPADPGTWLAGTTISFDPSVVEIFWTLARGATVLLTPSAGLRNGVGDLLASHPVTHLQCTPTLARLLLDHPAHRDGLGRLRQLLIGGEPLTPALVSRLYATGLQRITNIYGPTETTVWAFAHDVERDPSSPIPIGRPLPGVLAAVHAADAGPAAPGTVGELWIGGPGVTDGYFGLPELSTSKFVDDPEVAGRRWYLTGDLAREEADGTFTFHGRTDHQVKVNGVRIELGEIEATLESHPDVAQCAVALRSDQLDQQFLAAFVVAREGTVIEPTTMRRFLADSLPEHLVPRIVQPVDGLLLTSTGKVDRNRLPAVPEHVERREQVSDGGGAAGRPADPVTEMAVDFATALDTSEVQADSDFFDLGGNSLTATFLAALIFDRTGQKMPLRALVEAPSPRALVDLLAALYDEPDDGDAQVLVRFAPRRDAAQLYVVHGAGGNVMVFRELAALLAPELDLVGVQAAGVEPGVVADTTVDAMVDRYVHAIGADRREHGDTGPVLLGGYSNGGLIALHIARRLSGEGVEVAPVALIDSYVDEALPPGRLGRLAAVVASARGRGGNSLRDWARWSLTGWRSRFDSNRALDEGEHVLRYSELEATIERATAAAPALGAVPGGAFLMRARETNPLWRISYAWDPLVGSSVPTQWVAGGHLSLLRHPQVVSVAAAVLHGFGSWVRR